MSDVELGGGTAFINVGALVHPRKVNPKRLHSMHLATGAVREVSPRWLTLGDVPPRPSIPRNKWPSVTYPEGPFTGYDCRTRLLVLMHPVDSLESFGLIATPGVKCSNV